MHTRIGNVRCDFLHKATTTISQNQAMVCIEDLQVRNMSRSAAGTAEAPGRHVRAKSGLNKLILDQGWAEFRRQLDYKPQAKVGVDVKKVVASWKHLCRHWPTLALRERGDPGLYWVTLTGVRRGVWVSKERAENPCACQAMRPLQA